MKFDYINDVHLDFWIPMNANQIKFDKRTKEFARSLIPNDHSKTLIIGGDLGHFNRQNEVFLRELSNTYENIIIVFGNHDFYLTSTNQSNKYKRNSFNRINEMRLIGEKINGVTYLDGNRVYIDGFTIGGVGMWYDFSYGQKVKNQTFEQVRLDWTYNSNDFKLIRGMDTIDWFENQKEKLEKIISKCDVVITHMGPDWKFSDYKGKEEVHNSYYFFDGEELLKTHSNKVWCFGHVHLEIDERKGSWRFINQGLGYPDEKKFKQFYQVEI